VVEGTRYEVHAAAVSEIVDTTGAGDLFAAGFLAAHLEGLDVEKCLKLGAAAAAEVISHWGARPEEDLQAIRAKTLG
jgi:sugar/nucleoside kinase (ribokinase family)